MAEELKNNNQNEPDKSPDLSEIDKIKKERDEYLDGWQRARAELINYKKDEIKRFESVAKFSNEAIIRELIIVLDSFDLAILALESQTRINADLPTPLAGQALTDAEKNKVSGSLKGVYLIKSQIEDVLKNYGLEKMIVSVGQPFDPSLQEAVATIESDKPSGSVVEEVESGYFLSGKLIRPARVKVAK